MNKNEIMEKSHSWDGTFVPIKLLGNYIEIKQLIESYDLEPEKFYYTGRMFNEYAYANGTVMIEITLMTKQYFDMFEIKERIRINEKKHKELIEEKNYHAILFLLDKPFRFHWFAKLFKDIPEKDRYEIFISIYTSSEYGFDELPSSFVQMLIKKYKPKDMHNLETDQEILIVYRGEGSKSTPYEKAFSWTLDINVARRFANRFSGGGKVYKGGVYRDSVLCYLSSRTEKEVLVVPGGVFNVEEA